MSGHREYIFSHHGLCEASTNKINRASDDEGVHEICRTPLPRANRSASGGRRSFSSEIVPDNYITLCRGRWEWELEVYLDNHTPVRFEIKTAAPCGDLMNISFTEVFSKINFWSSRECFARFLAKMGVGVGPVGVHFYDRSFARGVRRDRYVAPTALA